MECARSSDLFFISIYWYKYVRRHELSVWLIEEFFHDLQGFRRRDMRSVLTLRPLQNVLLSLRYERPSSVHRERVKYMRTLHVSNHRWPLHVRCTTSFIAHFATVDGRFIERKRQRIDETNNVNVNCAKEEIGEKDSTPSGGKRIDKAIRGNTMMMIWLFNYIRNASRIPLISSFSLFHLHSSPLLRPQFTCGCCHLEVCGRQQHFHFSDWPSSTMWWCFGVTKSYRNSKLNQRAVCGSVESL